ncbi:MAG: hypothetical protein ACXVWZ_10600 [Nocardioides sp.]
MNPHQMYVQSDTAPWVYAVMLAVMCVFVVGIMAVFLYAVDRAGQATRTLPAGQPDGVQPAVPQPASTPVRPAAPRVSGPTTPTAHAV